MSELNVKYTFSTYTQEQVRAMDDRKLISEGVNAPDEITRELARRLSETRILKPLSDNSTGNV